MKTTTNPKFNSKKTVLGFFVLLFALGMFATPTSSVLASGTLTLSASPTTVTYGQSSTITWGGTNLASCSATWTSSTAPSGSQIVTPPSTTTYSMQCMDTTGNPVTIQKVTVTVSNYTAPPACNGTISVSPSSGVIPLNVAVAWSFTNGCETAALSNTQGGSYTPGTLSGTWSTTATADSESYTLKLGVLLCNGVASPTQWPVASCSSGMTATYQYYTYTASFQGTQSSPATVTVTNGTCPAGTTWQSTPYGYTTSPFTYTPSTSGDNMSINETYVPSGYTANGSSPSSQMIYQGGTYSFALSCIAPIKPTVTLTANTTNLTSCGQTATLSWTSSSATSCSASWTSQTGTSGSQTGIGVGSYQITCTGAGGSTVSAPVSITSSAGSCVPPSVSVTASPSTITAGNSSTISWSSSGATSCSSATWSSSTALSGSVVVTPGSTTTYTKTCSNVNGSTSGSAKLTVNPLPTYTASASAGSNGTISPSSSTVNSGSSATFTVTPNSGYTASVGGTCGGTLSGTTYTTNALTANCTVVASFTINSYTVTPSVSGSNGTISPSTAQTVNYGNTTTFTVTPNSGYIASVGGTCGGTLSGTTYTTNAITGSCTVVASFAQMSGTLTPSASPCTIASGSSSCTTNLTWNTVNPVSTSAVTSDTPNPNTVLASTNSGTLSSVLVPYGGRNFYLYNNNINLAQINVGTVCASGSSWNGSICSSYNYSLSPSPSTLTVTQGGSPQNETIAVTLTSGTAQPVTLLSLSGAPANLTYYYPNNGCGPTCNIFINVTAPSSVAVGNYPITVNGTSGGVNKSTSFTLSVVAPTSLTVTPSVATTAYVGDSVSWQFAVTGGKAPYTYTCTGTDFPNPAPASGSFSITYQTVGTKTATCTVNDSLGNTGSASASVQIVINPAFKEF
jgi:Divergent InlB B-repeat domain